MIFCEELLKFFTRININYFIKGGWEIQVNKPKELDRTEGKIVGLLYI